ADGKGSGLDIGAALLADRKWAIDRSGWYGRGDLRVAVDRERCVDVIAEFHRRHTSEVSARDYHLAADRATGGVEVRHCRTGEGTAGESLARHFKPPAAQRAGVSIEVV